jgi:hypothetical protein
VETKNCRETVTMPRPGKLLFFAFYFCIELNLQLYNFQHFCSLRLRGIVREGLFFFETLGSFSVTPISPILFHRLSQAHRDHLTSECRDTHANAQAARLCSGRPHTLYTARQTRADDWGSARCKPGMSNRGSPEGHMGHICVVMRATHDMRPAGRMFVMPDI